MWMLRSPSEQQASEKPALKIFLDIQVNFQLKGNSKYVVQWPFEQHCNDLELHNDS